MKRSALKRGKPLARKRMQRRPAKDPGFPEEVRLAVRRRSGGKCEINSKVCTKIATTGEPHHRKLRRHGDHRVVNALAACAPCHRYVHDNTKLAYLMGWLVHSWLDPAEVKVIRGDG